MLVRNDKNRLWQWQVYAFILLGGIVILLRLAQALKLISPLTQSVSRIAPILAILTLLFFFCWKNRGSRIIKVSFFLIAIATCGDLFFTVIHDLPSWDHTPVVGKLDRTSKVLEQIVIGTLIGSFLLIYYQLLKTSEETHRLFEKNLEILDLFFKHSLSQIVLLDKDFNFIRVNDAYARACARDVSDFPGNNHFDFYPSNNQEIFEEVVATKKPFQTFARPFVFPDHPEWETTYWDWALIPVLDDQGEVEMLMFSLNDVTERKRAEEELYKNHDLLNAIVEGTTDAISVKDLKGRYLLVNSSTARIMGKETEYIIGKDDTELYSSEIAIELREGDRAVIASGKAKTLEETIYDVKSNSERTYLSTKTPLCNSQGKVTGLIGISRDITERIRAYNAVRESEQRFRSIFEQAGVAVGLLESMTGRFIEINSKYTSIIGYSNEELVKMVLRGLWYLG